MAPCKFAEKVWNAQEAGAQGVRKPCCLFTPSALLDPDEAQERWECKEPRCKGCACALLQVIVVNYEDKHTTMEAPDDQDEISYK